MEVALRKVSAAAVDALSFDGFLSISESDGFGKIHLKEIYFKIHKRLYYCCGA